MTPHRHDLDYAPPRDGRSAARVLLGVARGWAVTPLVVGVAATAGFCATGHRLFASLGVLAMFGGW